MPPAFAQLVLLGKPIDRELTYRIPDDLKDLIQIGSRALVPFGQRWATGIVVALQNTSNLSAHQIKAIGELLDPYPLVEPTLLNLCRWIAGYYLCSLSEVLTSALPSGIHIDSGQHVALKDSEEVPKGLVSPQQQEVLTFLQTVESASVRQIERKLGKFGIQSAVYGLVRRGLLATYQKMSAPRVRVRKERIIKLAPTDPRWFETEFPILEKRAPRQAQCLRLLQEANKPMSASELTASGIHAATLKTLSDRHLIHIDTREVHRDPYANLDVGPPEDLVPTQDQQAALDQILQNLDNNTFAVHLLHGVTGSGKTLIYIRAVARARKEGKGAIVLVPEITLTLQTVRRFRAHFGDQIAVLHSALSAGERYDAWRAVREGKKTIVIGARSAVFAPVQNLGLIILDEEHDSSYKQSDPAPRYNARDVAVMRGKWESLPVVLGSATPSLESFHNAQIEKFNLLTLPKRIDSRPLPEVTLVDMKKEGGGLFSRPLRQKMLERIQKDERIILLQNRRGYAPTVQCVDCGQSHTCPNCQVTLTYHAHNRQMRCHYCGLNTPASSECPSCNSTHFQLLGVGTQRVEEALAEQFPHARVLRMDMDTTTKKGSHDQILEAFAKGEAEILLGTQMVAKGLDFPGVTLVGVISADTSIHLPDFRAGERTFQLLTQVSGRAGRGKVPGEVVVQTYLPDGEAVQAAREHDFIAFSDIELSVRRALGYPPYGRMVLFLFKGRDEHEVAQKAGLCAEALRAEAPPEVEVMGPVQAPLARLKQVFRWQVILKASAPGMINTLSRYALQQFGGKRKGVVLSIDVDPVSML
ncbi:MAG: primosomal protein N' [bacterium]|nr:primosomal protein N' [bacterium]